MSLKWYQCSKCSITIKKDSSPDARGCSSNSSVHTWHNLGEVGEKNYSCRKCGTVVQTKSSPDGRGCPTSGSHSWSSL
jgi:DNA-directed RNA polymerase subunit RPC12/RpoP